MSDTCHVCKRHYDNYSEGHTSNSSECLKNQLSDSVAHIATLEHALKECVVAFQIWKPCRDQILSRTKSTEAFDKALTLATEALKGAKL